MLLLNMNGVKLLQKIQWGTIWDKSYNMIANLNVIIEKCDEIGDEILGNELNKMIKGEAIALRAMFHFDLLRIFGPIYNTENSSLKTIPYITIADRSIVPLSSLEEATNKVMSDLDNAESLLSNDPIIKDGQTPNSYNGNTIFAFRQYRLNFFAVKALKARVEQWKGNIAKASEIAEEIINETKELFPFTPANQANHHYFPDRIFSTEMLFGLYHIKRNDEIYKAYFSPDLSINDLLTMAGEYSGGRLDVIYPDQNDYRFKMWAQKTVENKSVLFFNKFEDMSGNSEWSTDSYRYAIPLLTKSELYLIAAEGCSDINKASEYLSELRNARGIMSVTLDYDNRSSIVIEEFIREMIGKGQLYFLFKRLGMESIPNGSKIDGKMDVDLNIYSIPLPESETSQRKEN
jgi:hypothetical protein